MKKIMLTFALTAMLAMPSLSSAATWTIDNAHTSVGFKIRHLFSKVDGRFNEISGAIEFDPAKPEAGSVEVTIPVSSIDTRNEKRDGHLKSPDFFDAENHPNITFKSTKFMKDGDNLKVEGMLTMRGIEKPVTLDVEFLGAGPGMGGGQVAGFTAETKINRKEWDVNWNRALDHGGAVLGDDVEITIEIEAGSQG